MTARQVLLVPSDGEQIGVEVAGDGPAVVLLHGSGGNRATWWQQVCDLAADHTVVVVETRGAGRSSDAAGQGSPVTCAADLEAVRLHLGIDTWHLVGHSAGGWTALRYAATLPSQVLSVVVISSLAGVFPPAAEAHWETFTAALAARGWPAQELARPTTLTPEFCADNAGLAYLYQLVGALNPAPALNGFARIRDFDLTADDLGRLTMPVTFVTGSRDEIAPPAPVHAAAAAAGADFVEVDDAGHLLLWEDPIAFNGLLRELLS